MINHFSLALNRAIDDIALICAAISIMSIVFSPDPATLAVYTAGGLALLFATVGAMVLGAEIGARFFAMVDRCMFDGHVIGGLIGLVIAKLALLIFALNW